MGFRHSTVPTCLLALGLTASLSFADDIFHKAGKAVTSAAHSTVDHVSGVAKDIGDAAADLSKDVGNGFSNAAKATAQQATRAAKEAEAAGRTADAMAQRLSDLMVKDPAGLVSKATKQAAREAAKAAKEAAVAANASAFAAQASADSLAREVGNSLDPRRISTKQLAQGLAQRAALAAHEATDLAEAAEGQAELLARQVTVIPSLVAGRIVEEIKRSQLYQWMVTNAAALFMDPPKLIKVGSGTGEPVYYVNGMLTNLETSIVEGTYLSNTLGRPVYLIHNPTMMEGWTGTPGMWEDLSEAVYDRSWPETLGAGVSIFPIPPLEGFSSSMFSPGIPFTQLNTTTRQITHLLYHAPKSIAIVSHSQGCLQVRNAILTAALFRGESWTHRNLYWTATGIPLSTVEVWPSPDKFHHLVNHGDYVAQLIGLQGGPGTLDAMSGASHDFIEKYVGQIRKEWLVP